MGAVLSIKMIAYIAVAPVASAIAANVPRERRGTGFGIASSAQAISFLIGPTAAAAFAATSLRAGFVGLSALLIALGLILALRLRQLLRQLAGILKCGSAGAHKLAFGSNDQGPSTNDQTNPNDPMTTK